MSRTLRPAPREGFINHRREAEIRVPSIGLTLEERIITREGYRFAERMLRGYQDPPGLFEKTLASCRDFILGLYQSLVRH